MSDFTPTHVWCRRDTRAAELVELAGPFLRLADGTLTRVGEGDRIASKDAPTAIEAAWAAIKANA